MNIYNYQEAFGAWDKTTRPMRKAIREWFSLYYGAEATAQADPCQRVAYTVVNKLVKTVFAEYASKTKDPRLHQFLTSLEEQKQAAMQLALVGGECYIKPCPGPKGISFTLIPRDNVLIFARDARGEPTDVGTAEQSVWGNHYYTLLERRRMDAEGYLTIENRLYRSLTGQSLGQQVDLATHPDYASLVSEYTFEKPVGSVGLVRMRTPMLNCVDGSLEGVSVYAAAAGLIRSIDRNEAQLNGEFIRGQSRIIASRDLLDADKNLTDDLFVGLDDDPEQVGLTIFSPALREQSYLARKQEYLRNVETVIGLKRGLLSDTNAEERTATEIASSQGEHNLTAMEFQGMWEKTLRDAAGLCAVLAELYCMNAPKDIGVSVDWGNGVLYDEEKRWEDYQKMVEDGLLRPEIALGWRFNLPVDSEEDLKAIREKYMPRS